MAARSGLLLDSMEAFWSMVEHLGNGQIVDEQKWDTLFRTSGYRALATEFPPPALRARFELAFVRGREEEAQQAAGQDWLVVHYLRVKAERVSIQAFIARLDAPNLVSEAVRHTGAWLPAGTTEGAPMPDVALAIFDADARGYAPVVVDAGFARHLGEANLIMLLAHEFHHWFRNRVKPVPGGHLKDLAWVLDQIQAEGMADQINVPIFLEEGGRLGGFPPGWV